jgi:hypothetical protein
MNRADRSQKYRAILTGVTAVAGTTGSIPLKGVVTASSEIASKLQLALDAPAKTAAAEAAYHQAVADEESAVTAANAICLGVKDWALVQYGSQPAVLAQFGLEAPHRKSPTVETKAAAAAKGRQTRAKLGTKGKRQKEAAKAAPDAAPAAPEPAPPTKGS